MDKESVLENWRGKPVDKAIHGRQRAACFIYVIVAMSNMANVPNFLNLVTYFHGVMHMDVASSSTAMTNFFGGTSAFALFGGFLSDSYFSRFRTILCFGPLPFVGYGLLAMQAHFAPLHPPECNMLGHSSNCKHIHGLNYVLLVVALCTIALGEGVLRANLPSFGGDQFDDNDSAETRQKSTFFNWYTFGISIGAFTGLILVVWIENNKGWDQGFALSACLTLLGVLVFSSGFPFYRYQKPSGSPLTRMLQVFVAAFRKRKLDLAENEEALHPEQVKEDMIGGEVLQQTKSFKFLDKASIFNGNANNWSLCTVTQVEETKIVLRMVPLFLCTVFSYTPIPLLLSLTVQQGSTMDTKFGAIQISPATLLIIPVMFQMVTLVAYDRFIVPFARKLTGYKNGITHLQRAGVGFIATSIATCVAALVERKRKRVAEEHELVDSGTELPMSVMWLGGQFFFIGIVDVSTFVGLLEFFNSEFSRGMKSLGTAVFWCVIGLSSFMGSILVQVVNNATKRTGNMGWLEGNNLNKNYLDRFYWLLSVIGLVGFLNYLYWAKRYVYRQNPRELSS